MIASLKNFSEYFQAASYVLLSLLMLVPFYFSIPYALNESFNQAQKYIPQYESSFVFIQQLMPQLAYPLAMILITKTGYNFPILVFVGLAILSGFFNTIFSWGSEPIKWEIVAWDLLARLAQKGVTFFMIFWSTNYSKFGGKNGVLGVFYLCVLYFFLGFADYAWHKWDQDIVQWWIDFIGIKRITYDCFFINIFTILSWVLSIYAQRIIRNSEPN